MAKYGKLIRPMPYKFKLTTLSKVVAKSHHMYTIDVSLESLELTLFNEFPRPVEDLHNSKWTIEFSVETDDDLPGWAYVIFVSCEHPTDIPRDVHYCRISPANVKDLPALEEAIAKRFDWATYMEEPYFNEDDPKEDR